MNSDVPKQSPVTKAERLKRFEDTSVCKQLRDQIKVKRDAREELYYANYKPKKLSEATSVVGTCPDMCPEFERLDRQVSQELHFFEMLAGTENDPCPQADPRLAVKKYRRSAAGKDPEIFPEDIRPPAVLQKTMDYLMNDILSRTDQEWIEIYNFIRDRGRALRKDFKVQNHLKGPECVDVLERLARFLIFSDFELWEMPESRYSCRQNRHQIFDTLTTLMEVYDDELLEGRHYSHEAEFRAYYVLLNVDNALPINRVHAWSESVLNQSVVKASLEFHTCFQNKQFYNFFRKIKQQETTFLMACILHMVFDEMRRDAVEAFNSSLIQRGKPMSTQNLIQTLALSDEEDAKLFCDHWGLEIVNEVLENSQVVPSVRLGKKDGSRGALLDPVGKLKLKKSTIVASKRNGMSLKQLVHGQFAALNAAAPSFVPQTPSVKASVFSSPLPAFGQTQSVFSASSFNAQTPSVFAPAPVTTPAGSSTPSFFMNPPVMPQTQPSLPTTSPSAPHVFGSSFQFKPMPVAPTPSTSATPVFAPSPTVTAPLEIPAPVFQPEPVVPKPPKKDYKNMLKGVAEEIRDELIKAEVQRFANHIIKMQQVIRNFTKAIGSDLLDSIVKEQVHQVVLKESRLHTIQKSIQTESRQTAEQLLLDEIRFYVLECSRNEIASYFHVQNILYGQSFYKWRVFCRRKIEQKRRLEEKRQEFMSEMRSFPLAFPVSPSKKAISQSNAKTNDWSEKLVRLFLDSFTKHKTPLDMDRFIYPILQANNASTNHSEDGHLFSLKVLICASDNVPSSVASWFKKCFKFGGIPSSLRHDTSQSKIYIPQERPPHVLTESELDNVKTLQAIPVETDIETLAFFEVKNNPSSSCKHRLILLTQSIGIEHQNNSELGNTVISRGCLRAPNWDCSLSGAQLVVFQLGGSDESDKQRLISLLISLPRYSQVVLLVVYMNNNTNTDSVARNMMLSRFIDLGWIRSVLWRKLSDKPSEDLQSSVQDALLKLPAEPEIITNPIARIWSKCLLPIVYGALDYLTEMKRQYLNSPLFLKALRCMLDIHNGALEIFAQFCVRPETARCTWPAREFSDHHKFPVQSSWNSYLNLEKMSNHINSCKLPSLSTAVPDNLSPEETTRHIYHTLLSYVHQLHVKFDSKESTFMEECEKILRSLNEKTLTRLSELLISISEQKLCRGSLFTISGPLNSVEKEVASKSWEILSNFKSSLPTTHPQFQLSPVSTPRKLFTPQSVKRSIPIMNGIVEDHSKKRRITDLSEPPRPTQDSSDFQEQLNRIKAELEATRLLNERIKTALSSSYSNVN